MINRRTVTAIIVSLALHAVLLAAIIFHDLFRVYRSVEGLKVGDYGGQTTVRLINPADYGYGRKPRLGPAPRRVTPLEELERRRKAEKKVETEDKEKEERSAEAARKEIASDKEAGSLKFGRLDTHPIKKHVAAIWQAHEQGRLDLPDTFRIVVACKVNPDGSFSSVRITESSGSDELDRTALAILIEISNQRAFAPLARLSSVSVKLEVGPGSAGFSLVGFASNAEVASDMAGQYQLMISTARLFTSNPQTRELLNHASIRSDLTRVTANLRVPRTIAAQMMRDGFSKGE